MSAPNQTAFCPRCKRDLPPDKFFRKHRGHQHYCGECMNEIKKLRRKLNPEHEKSKRRKLRLKNKYGLTPEVYEEMLIDQGGKCLICGASYKDFNRGLVIDHDHKTGKVRGLLCDNCNNVLGHCNDNPDILVKALNYLLKNK